MSSDQFTKHSAEIHAARNRSAEPSSRSLHPQRSHHANVSRLESGAKAGEGFSAQSTESQLGGSSRVKTARRRLCVMKFGGTSVGDAACIGKVVEIVRAASEESDLVVVVSAMAGVTNRLLEAATQAEAGKSQE